MSGELLFSAKSNIDRAVPGMFDLGVLGDAVQSDVARSVIIAVADWLDEQATRDEISREAERWAVFPATPSDALNEVVRRLRAEVAVP